MYLRNWFWPIRQIIESCPLIRDVPLTPLASTSAGVNQNQGGNNAKQSNWTRNSVDSFRASRGSQRDCPRTHSPKRYRCCVRSCVLKLWTIDYSVHWRIQTETDIHT
ncbi:uncharacterized protein LOC143357977 [Halictus rubicundus]|uniref:uncharacterized protein LOC143357977 n=1 Tax=Halictus rubicundus TaxID=77578 RepID=UPI0040375348